MSENTPYTPKEIDTAWTHARSANTAFTAKRRMVDEINSSPTTPDVMTLQVELPKIEVHQRVFEKHVAQAAKLMMAPESPFSVEASRIWRSTPEYTERFQRTGRLRTREEFAAFAKSLDIAPYAAGRVWLLLARDARLPKDAPTFSFAGYERTVKDEPEMTQRIVLIPSEDADAMGIHPACIDIHVLAQELEQGVILGIEGIGPHSIDLLQQFLAAKIEPEL